MNRRKAVLFLCIFLINELYAIGQTKIKIACVGNSITYGALVENREKNNYPAQLHNMLGNRYEVMNFGVSGRTLLRKGDYPYWQKNVYHDALKFNPNIVTILLGTNGSKAINRTHLDEFEKDYTDLIDSFRSLPSHPRVILLLPLPSFYEDTTSIYNPVIQQQIIPRIQDVAYKTGCEIVSLYSLFIDKADLLVDKIHPSSIGAGIIARRLFEGMHSKPASGNLFSKINQQKTLSNFYGFECADFTYNGRDCKW